MEVLQSIGQFFARWLAQLETTFVEKQRYLLLVDGLKNTLIITAGAWSSAWSSGHWWP